MTPPLIVAAAIVDSLAAPTRVLCAQRSYPPALAGQWEFPGGKVEPGEAPDVALHRELAEELGVAVTLGSTIDSQDDDGAWPLPNGSRMRLWWAELSAQSPQPTPGASHSALQWCEAEQISSLEWLEGDRPIIIDVTHRLEKFPDNSVEIAREE